jgi:iron complex transport system substrate-binding protein
MTLRGAVLVLLLAAAAIAARAQPIELIDDLGEPVRLTAPAQRIVSLLPSLTETVCALGACTRLVGTDRYSNWPREVQALPKLGGLDDAHLERIVALKPDLVLAGPSARVVPRLRALGLTVLVLDSRSHADVERSLEQVARVLGRPGEGQRRWAALQAELEAAAARVPAAVRGARVFFEVDAGPFAAGPSSFLGETMARLGLRNAVPRELGPFPKLNPEWVLREQPDILIAERRSLDQMAGRPGWSQLRALKPGRHCGFDQPRFEVLVRPGPRLGEAARLLADCVAGLKPEAT